MAKQYIYCDSSNNPVVITVSLSKSTCVQTSNWQQGDEFHRVWTQEMTFSIPAAINETLRVFWVKVEDVNDDFGDSGEFTQNGWTDIPVGQTEVTIPIVCRLEKKEDFGSGGMGEYTMNLILFELRDQVNVPACAATGCDIAFVSHVSTPTSLRGAGDGSLEVTVSGTTGSTHVWRINGANAFTGGTTQTFTDLSGGEYTITLIEGECAISEVFLVGEGDFRTGDMAVNKASELTAANNPIIYNISTAVNTLNPQPFIGEFEITNTLAENVELVFTLDFPNVYEAHFRSRGFPNKANYFLASQLKDNAGQVIGSNSLGEIATSLAEVLQNDLVIGRLYEVVAEGTKVRLRSYESNSRLNLENKVQIIGSNITFNQTQEGTTAYDGQLVEDYSIYVELFINEIIQYGQILNKNTFKRVGEIELPMARNNRHLFDLSQTLRNFVDTPKLDFNFSGFTTYVDMMAGYYINYGEKYPLVSNTNTKKKRVKGSTDISYIVNSALDYEQANDMTSYLGKQISGLNPEFDFTYSSFDVTFTDVTLPDYTVTNIQYRLRQGVSPTNVVQDWQTGNTFTIGYNSYLIDISGTTQVDTGTTYNAVVTRRFWFYPPEASKIFDPNYRLTALRYMDVKFLTNSPTPKQVHRNSTEYLGFILPVGYPRGLKCKGNLEFYNGTSLNDVDLFTITDAQFAVRGVFGGVLMLAVGYDKLGLESYENAGQTKIRKVEIWIENVEANNPNIPLTETKTYLYEIDEQPRRFGTAFLNKLGCYDIFDWSGEVVDSQDIFFEEYQQPRQIGLDGSSERGFKHNTVYDTRFTKQVTVNSGSINEETYDWLMELLQSNRIYNYTEPNQPYLTYEGHTATKSTNENEYFVQAVFRATIHENNVKV